MQCIFLGFFICDNADKMLQSFAVRLVTQALKGAGLSSLM